MAHTAAAEQTLRESLEKVACEQKYTDPDIKLSTVSTEGANYTSFLFEATISSKGKDDIKLFAKVAAIGESLRSHAPMKVFDTERLFYTELKNEYRQLEERHGVVQGQLFKAPKVYAVNPTMYKETIVMDNLTAKGYTSQDRFKSVNWDYAAASFTELAKMHALSMALKNEKPEVYKRIIEEFKFQLDTNASGKEIEAVVEQNMKNTIEVTREENKERLVAYLDKVMKGGMLGSFMKFYLPGDSPVIRHGDFRPSNLMHKLNEDGTLDIYVVDFQTLLPGTPVIDLLYFIFLGTDKKFRDKYFDQLVDHYYKELSAAISRLGMNAKTTYPRTKFDEEMKENLSYGLLVALTTLPVVTVDAADAPKVTGDQELSSFGNMKLSSVFADRINGIFDDFIRWEIL